MLSLSRRDWIMALLISAAMVFASWGFGGYKEWSQTTMYVLSALSFIALFVPMGQEKEASVKSVTVKRNLVKLVRFPVFWLTLLLIFYMVIQYYNPSHRFRATSKMWLISDFNMSPVHWLPTGIPSAPESLGNPLVYIKQFLMVLALVCAAWVGLRRRQQLLIVLCIFAASSALLGLVAIVQKMQDSQYILWTYEWKRGGFASFFYRNQGAAFFNMCIGVSATLNFYFFHRAVSRHSHSSPHYLFLLNAAMLFLAVVLAASRGGWLWAALMFAALVLLSLYSWVSTWRDNVQKKGTIVFVVMSSVLLAIAIATANFDFVQVKWKKLVQLAEAEETMKADQRFMVSQATWHMFLQKKTFGWGADSFALVFPEYRKLFEEKPRLTKKGAFRTVWKEAHNDPLQYLMELGIVGGSILLLIWGFFIAKVLWLLPYWRTWTCMLFFTVMVLLGHSFFDIILKSSSILLVWCILLVLLVKLLESEKRQVFIRKRGSEAV